MKNFLKTIQNYFNSSKSEVKIDTSYRGHSEAMIISCYFNYEKSPYRKKAFDIFYKSIKHLNHRIIECAIGDSEFELIPNDNIQQIRTESLLWHKEALLNKIVEELPRKYKYIFWLDADIIFTNKNWQIESVNKLSYFGSNDQIIQLFEYCVHMEKDELVPSINLEEHKEQVFFKSYKNRKVWKSFASNIKNVRLNQTENETYDLHGHVGFAWGAKREVLHQVPLYDKALIGGADHIIAHAAAGQIIHPCIAKSFTDDIESVKEWSDKFYKEIGSYKLNYTNGDLYHIWHGDIEKRQYLKRIQDFTKSSKNITEKDDNGLYVNRNIEDENYMKSYFKQREVSPVMSNSPQMFGIDPLLGAVIIDKIINDSNDNSDYNIDNLSPHVELNIQTYADSREDSINESVSDSSSENFS